MKFDLSEDQTALQDAVDRYLTGELDHARRLAIVDSEDGQDQALWQGLSELGVHGVMVPESYGGIGLGMLDAAVIAEVLGAHATPGPFLGHLLAALAIAEGGTDQQKETWLPGLASGEMVGTVALGEAGNRWQPEEWQLAGGDILSGTKHNVLYPAQADVMVVGVDGGGLMLVDHRANPSVVDVLPCLDATRRIAHVQFERTTAESLGGSAARLRDAALVLLAADAFGGARQCLDMAVTYAQEREQFGVVIGRFQGLKHQLANMAVDVEPARGLYWYAAHSFDALPDDSARVAAVAKAHICDRFVQAARDATEAHGGIGYTWEYPLHIWLKRAVFDRMFMGTSATHRRRSAALSGWMPASD